MIVSVHCNCNCHDRGLVTVETKSPEPNAYDFRLSLQIVDQSLPKTTLRSVGAHITAMCLVQCGCPHHSSVLSRFLDHTEESGCPHHSNVLGAVCVDPLTPHSTVYGLSHYYGF